MVVRQKLGFNSSDFIIVFIGRLIKEKGLLELLKAFTSIGNKAKLLIIGSNDFSKSQKTKYIEELYCLTQNNKNIIFTGYINYYEIHKYYKIADLAVFPSMCEEAFNLSLLEAMATKIPVIITKSGGMPEVVTANGAIIIERDSNLISNLTKYMLKIVNYPKEMIDMVNFSFNRAKKFTNIVYAKKMLDILDN